MVITYLCTCNNVQLYVKTMWVVSYLIFYLFIYLFESGSCCVAQAGLELIIILPQVPSASNTGMCHHNWAMGGFECCYLFWKTASYGWWLANSHPIPRPPSCSFFLEFWNTGIYKTEVVQTRKRRTRLWQLAKEWLEMPDSQELRSGATSLWVMPFYVRLCIFRLCWAL